MNTLSPIPRLVIMLMLLASAAGLYAQGERNNPAGRWGAPDKKAARSSPGIYFTAGAESGLMYGTALELVYGAPSGADYLSRLDWELKPLYYYGFFFKMLFETPSPAWLPLFAFSFKNGVPGNTGYLEDRDWLDPNHQELTHFSRHDNFVRYALFLDLDLGTQFRPWRTGTSPRFNFYLNFSWMNLMWESLDGYIQYPAPSSTTPATYPPWDASLRMQPYIGPAINYSQTWLTAAPAVGLEFPFLRVFLLEAAVTLGPFNFCVGDDYHVARDLRFHDNSRWGVYFRPQARFRFSPAPRFTISIHGSWKLLTGLWGASKISEGNTEIWEDQGMTGAGLTLWEAGLSISFTP